MITSWLAWDARVAEVVALEKLFFAALEIVVAALSKLSASFVIVPGCGWVGVALQALKIGEGTTAANCSPGDSAAEASQEISGPSKAGKRKHTTSRKLRSQA